MEWISNFYFPKPILEFLKKPILGINPIFDYWLIIHFISGYLLHMLLGPGKGLTVIFLLVAYEFFETHLFDEGLAIREPLINQVLDIIVGYAGYMI